MENLDIEDIQNLYDIFRRNECLDDRIRDTSCLKSFYILLNIKRHKIINNQSKKITFPLNQIYEQDSENLHLQCNVLKLALSVTENENLEVKNLLSYVNQQISHPLHLPATSSLKVVHILKEICIVKYKDVLKGNTGYIHKFLLDNLSGRKSSSIRIYILSHILHNYLNLFNEAKQVDFISQIFLCSRLDNDLDILCTVCSYSDVQLLLIKNQTSILYTIDFWEFLGNSISSLDNSNLQKQATFLLEKLVDVYYNNILNADIPFIKINNMPVGESKKIWQHFFVLLESSKEKQLHLVWPSLTLLQYVKQLNNLWQKPIYKILLNHSQDSVVLFTLHYALQENVMFPGLFEYFLLAINKTDSFSSHTSTFEKLSLFCNNLKEEDFWDFLDNILNITWTPIAMWCLFNNLFCSKLQKKVPLIFFKSIYKQVLKMPHIYIRNGCAKIFLHYFLNNYEWKDSAESILKMLVNLRDYNYDLFANSILNHVDICYSFIDNFKETEWIMIKNDVKLFEVFVQIIEILKAQKSLDLLVKNIEKFDELLIIVYANNFDYFCNTDMENIIDKTDHLSQRGVDNIIVIIYNLMKNNDFNTKMYFKIIDILSEPSNNNRNMVYVALYLSIHFFTSCEVMKDIVNKWRTANFIGTNKFDEDILILFCELYFLTTENCDISFLENICNNQSDLAISKMFEKFFTIIAPKNSTTNFKFLEIGINILPSLTKSKHFNTCIQNYINCLFLINWSEYLCDVQTLNLIKHFIKTLLELTEAHPTVAHYLSINIKKFVSQFDYDNCSNILIPVIVDLLLKGIIIRKEERVEYSVCQEIYEKFEDGEDNPNIRKLVTRLCSLDSMLKVIIKRTECADDFASCLVAKYKIHFNKRYFPDSQIHLQKLRIIQALLIIHPFINRQRQPVINLIMESFCIEIHQPCIKQLMQWLLFFLLKDEDNAIPLLADKIKSTTKTQPSTVSAFILVLLYVTFTKPETFWFSVVETLLPWCMGPHFKLRVYAQMAIRTLHSEARKRSYQDFIFKYGFLDKSVNFIIEASGQAFQDTLKADEQIISSFDPNRDYSIQTILIDIPKLNDVTATEWQNIPYYKFTSLAHIPIINEDNTFANSIRNSIAIKKHNTKLLCEDISINPVNIQRKITPWKISIEEPEDNKQLGDFILIASLIDKPTNLGGLSRTCEVFGVKQLVLNDAKITKDKNFKGLSMTSENWVECVEVNVSDLKKFIFELKAKSYCVVGAEQTSESISLNEYKFKKRTALLLGNEKEGIPPNLIPILDACIEIPQLGLVRSLNVHVAGATFIWEYSKQHLIK